MSSPLIAITAGEPAGIGPDITVQLAQTALAYQPLVFADKHLLRTRAQQLALPLTLIDYPSEDLPDKHQAGTLLIKHVPLATEVNCGQLNTQNANYVMETLQQAGLACLDKRCVAVVTGPVHKGILNAAGHNFFGHTEFYATLCRVPQTVMLLACEQLRVALTTTHMPLQDVSQKITQPYLKQVIRILHQDLQEKFAISDPRIAICGLNPHAGEQGYLGREEIDTIIPVIKMLQQEGLDLLGPLPADTAFTRQYIDSSDVILTMYHDQGLPVLKHLSFSKAVNITLGLPIIRTSVDHGTALDLAGSGRANGGSLQA